MKQYSYDGPVMKFDICVASHWKGETTAVSESKARSNLAFRYKKENGLSSKARITLPGKLIVKED